jgi:hypothetical protein
MSGLPEDHVPLPSLPWKTFTFVKNYHKSFPYIVYKTVSRSNAQAGFTLASRELVQKWLSGSTVDPIIKILSRNSNLTKTQLETILIDFIAPNISGKSLTNREKALLRLTKAGISRGAFNHTLKQARRNIIQSMYTIILLGYLGIFEDTRLDPYIEVANKLKEYVGAYKDVISTNELATEHLRLVTMLREELENTLEKLATPRTLSKT